MKTIETCVCGIAREDCTYHKPEPASVCVQCTLTTGGKCAFHAAIELMTVCDARDGDQW
jgi:hypothetical protein